MNDTCDPQTISEPTEKSGKKEKVIFSEKDFWYHRDVDVILNAVRLELIGSPQHQNQDDIFGEVVVQRNGNAVHVAKVEVADLGENENNPGRTMSFRIHFEDGSEELATIADMADRYRYVYRRLLKTRDNELDRASIMKKLAELVGDSEQVEGSSKYGRTIILNGDQLYYEIIVQPEDIYEGHGNKLINSVDIKVPRKTEDRISRSGTINIYTPTKVSRSFIESVDLMEILDTFKS